MDKINFNRWIISKNEKLSSEDPSIFQGTPESAYCDSLQLVITNDNEISLTTMGKYRTGDNYCYETSRDRNVLIFVYSGSIQYGNETLNAGNFLMVPPTISYSLISRQPSVYYWISTNDAIITKLFLISGYDNLQSQIGKVQDKALCARCFEDALYHLSQEYNPKLFLISCTSRFLAYITTPKKSESLKTSEQLFKRMIMKIEYTFGNTSVNYLSEHYHVSTRHVYGLFKKNLNISPNEYIVKVKMNSAIKFISSTDYSIAKIAELLGYSDYKHFSRAYTKYYKIPPTKHRQQLKKV